MTTRALAIYGLLITVFACQTAKKQRPDSTIAAKAAVQLNKDEGQTVKWRWNWNGKTATLREPFLFQIMFANAPYLGLRADNSIAAATGCVAGADCSVDCSFEVYRPSSKDGEVLTDRLHVSCLLQNRSLGRLPNQIFLSGLIDGLNVSYRPKTDGERSVALHGPFASELYFSFQKAQQAGRFLATNSLISQLQPKPANYQYLVLKNNWYFLFRLDNQAPVPGDSNLSLLCSPPPSDSDDSTCVFKL